MLAIDQVRRAVRSAVPAAAWALVVGACGEGDVRGGAETPPSARAAALSASAAPARPAASLSAPPASSAAAPHPFIGTWKGSYRSEKVNPTLDPTVDDDVWKGDDGRRHAGPGEAELTIAPDGTVAGILEGALGASRIEGVADEQMVRAAVVAPTEDGATGTLIGKREADGLVIEIRTSDGAGKTPRLARGTLKTSR